MHISKNERAGLIAKREEMPKVKKIYCINCHWPIAEGNIAKGKIVIECRKCKTPNAIEAM